MFHDPLPMPPSRRSSSLPSIAARWEMKPRTKTWLQGNGCGGAARRAAIRGGNGADDRRAGSRTDGCVGDFPRSQQRRCRRRVRQRDYCSCSSLNSDRHRPGTRRKSIAGGQSAFRPKAAARCLFATNEAPDGRFRRPPAGSRRQKRAMASACKRGSPVDHKPAGRVTILSALQEFLSLGNDLETPYG